MILVNSTGRHPFSIITHTDEGVIYPLATFPPYQSATFIPGWSLAVGRKVPTSAIVPLERWVVGKIQPFQPDMFFHLPLLCSFPSTIADIGEGWEIAWGKTLSVRLDSRHKMDSNAFLASQPVKTSMRHKEKSRFSPLFTPIHILNLCVVVFLVPWVLLLKKQSLKQATNTGVYLTQHVKDLMVILPFRVWLTGLGEFTWPSEFTSVSAHIYSPMSESSSYIQIHKHTLL